MNVALLVLTEHLTYVKGPASFKQLMLWSFYIISVAQSCLLTLILILQSAMKYFTSHLFLFISAIYCGEQTKNFTVQDKKHPTLHTTINTENLQYFTQNA